ncbi:replication protein A 70 kDa DNA-binding subunit C [Setaria viridis]|uniref:Replication factor-A protein 1 N-terminal domain-containing protein n=1 Tax=Setaria viridis TaxID=4556 RepID=A0A4U6VC39_SETVI|nr:replication protein A 70 kDa DNA-binding subunit C-like [Setaria viridis]TKW24699.1 hypothetical protein SEVIR_3G066500v2 [Setaria viridis]
MGGGLEVDLSHGAVAAMWWSPGSRLRPVLQVADARHVPDGSGLSPAPEQRYRIDLSDGVHSQPGTLAASLNRLVRDGTLRRGSVVRVLDFVCDYRRRTITVIQLQILQTECALIGSLKPYEPTRKSREFTTRSVRYALRPDCEPYFGGQHIHQSCIASEAEISANGLSYHGACGLDTQDKGTLLTVGGIRKATPSVGTEANAQDLYQDLMAASSAHNLSKRPSWEISVDNPPETKSGSLEDYIRDLAETVATRSQKRGDREQEELDRAMLLIEEDGLQEGSELYCQALYLCRNAMYRRVFTKIKTKEGRLNWIQFNWDKGEQVE